MNVLEKEIEDLIYDSLKQGKSKILVDRGLRPICWFDTFKRQLDLGDYGRLDLVGFRYEHIDVDGDKKVLNIGVFEIKKGEVNNDTYIQAIRYCKGLQHYIGDKYPCLTLTFKIILIGTSVSKSDFVYLTDFTPNLSIYTTRIDLEKGVTFKLEQAYYNTKSRPIKGDEVFESEFKKYVKKKIYEHVNIGRLPSDYYNDGAMLSETVDDDFDDDLPF